MTRGYRKGGKGNAEVAEGGRGDRNGLRLPYENEYLSCCKIESRSDTPHVTSVSTAATGRTFAFPRHMHVAITSSMRLSCNVCAVSGIPHHMTATRTKPPHCGTRQADFRKEIIHHQDKTGAQAHHTPLLTHHAINPSSTHQKNPPTPSNSHRRIPCASNPPCNSLSKSAPCAPAISCGRGSS